MQVEQGLCLCGSGKLYMQCCRPYHTEGCIAETAEALMRSRYAAYVLSNEHYLLASWHQSTRPASLNLDDTSATKWLGLKVLQVKDGQVNNSEGTVEFVARYKINGKAYKLHEVSRFIKEAGQWYYVEGDIQA